MTRTPLPQRRLHEVFDFEHNGQIYTVGFGRAYLGAPIQEVWLNCGKSGSEMETLARDSAVLLSIALQYGAPPEEISRKVMRELDGAVSGLAGKVLNLMTGEQ